MSNPPLPPVVSAPGPGSLTRHCSVCGQPFSGPIEDMEVKPLCPRHWLDAHPEAADTIADGFEWILPFLDKPEAG
jgi:hypothetical protein